MTNEHYKCPKCNRPASGMYCQSCGTRLLAQVPEPTRVFTANDVRAAHDAGHAAGFQLGQNESVQKHYGAIIEESGKLRKTLKENEQKALAKYADLVGDHEQLKEELSKTLGELVTLKTGTQGGAVGQPPPQVASVTPNAPAGTWMSPKLAAHVAEQKALQTGEVPRV